MEFEKSLISFWEECNYSFEKIKEHCYVLLLKNKTLGKIPLIIDIPSENYASATVCHVERFLAMPEDKYRFANELNRTSFFAKFYIGKDESLIATIDLLLAEVMYESEFCMLCDLFADAVETACKKYKK